MNRLTFFFNKRTAIIKIVAALLLWTSFIVPARAAESLDSFDKVVLGWANECAEKVVEQFNLYVSSGTLTPGQIFDTFYIPIPNTSPQKYKTQYDQYSDEVMRPIIDSYVKAHKRIAFVILVDRNGYNPTHNTKYAQPITGDTDHDTKLNRTKRIFNDTTGLAAALNTKPFLLQKYSRDTGEKMKDLSVPIYINQQHWGAIRVGYK